MTPPNPGGLDPQGEARQALAAAVKDYGPGVLANPSLLGNLFKDLLPGSPREASLLVAASEAGASTMLEQQVAGVGPDAAVRTVASDLSRDRALDPQASLWAVGEVARAMGYPVSEGGATPPPPMGATLPWVTPGATTPPAAAPLPWAGAVVPPPAPPAPPPFGAAPPPLAPPQPVTPAPPPYQPYAGAPPAQPPSPWGGSPPPAMPPPAVMPPPVGMGYPPPGAGYTPPGAGYPPPGASYPPQPQAFATRRRRTPPALIAVIAAVVVVAAYFGIAAAAKLPPFSAKPVASLTCPSGEHVVSGACVATSTPTPAVPSASASLPISGTVTGGYGDTATNPDQSFACAFNVIADDNVTTVAYLTVAGNSSTETSDLCSGFEAQQYYDEVTSLNVSGSAYCWMTAQDGGATLRFYTAPDGNSTDTHEICAAVFAAAGISP
jgi:hypothetical protein